MKGWSRLIVVLCLAPGAAVTIYSMVTMYRAMGSGADVDEQKLRTGMQLGFRWIVVGLVVAAVLLFLRAIFLVLRPRRRQP
jgi:hypothetical protein